MAMILFEQLNLSLHCLGLQLLLCHMLMLFVICSVVVYGGFVFIEPIMADLESRFTLAIA